MSYIDNIEYVYVQCGCYHPGDTIRINKDEDGMIWIEFQTWSQHSFWRRLKNAFQVLFKKRPVNWSELTLNDKAAVGIVKFLRSASPAVQKMLEDQERADHGVY